MLKGRDYRVPLLELLFRLLTSLFARFVLALVSFSLPPVSRVFAATTFAARPPFVLLVLVLVSDSPSLC